VRYEDPLTPSELSELFGMMKSHSGKYLLAAGGTDLFVSFKGRMPRGSILIDMSAIREMKGICLHESGEYLVIGAMETMTSISENELIRNHAACLSESASKVGSWQIRNRATLGGNVAKGSPSADTPSALAAIGASAVLSSLNGSRMVPVQDISKKTGSRKIKSSEIISAFHVPLREGMISSFAKLGIRREMSVSRVNLAVSVLPVDGSYLCVTEPRVYAGTLGAPARRCEKAEKALTAVGLDASSEFRQALAKLVDKAIPGRASQQFKRSAIQALGEEALLSLREKARSRLK
jgi:CO/xanthine dehydrogenase FAD-binding subunit